MHYKTILLLRFYIVLGIVTANISNIRSFFPFFHTKNVVKYKGYYYVTNMSNQTVKFIVYNLTLLDIDDNFLLLYFVWNFDMSLN